jgi:hypothetical protein
MGAKANQWVVGLSLMPYLNVIGLASGSHKKMLDKFDTVWYEVV